MDPVIERVAADTRLVAREHLRWHVDRVRLQLGMLEPLPLPQGEVHFRRRLRKGDSIRVLPAGAVVFPCTCNGTLHMHIAIDPTKTEGTPHE
jgi:hypothetical protein